MIQALEWARIVVAVVILAGVFWLACKGADRCE